LKISLNIFKKGAAINVTTSFLNISFIITSKNYQWVLFQSETAIAIARA